MLMSAFLLSVAGTSCAVDHHLPPIFSDWRYGADYGDRFCREISAEPSLGLLEFRELPERVSPAFVRHISVSKAGTYAIAKSSTNPVVIYGDRRDANGERQPVRPVASRGGPGCSTIVGVDFFRLPVGNYYLTTPANAQPTRTLVKRVD